MPNDTKLQNRIERIDFMVKFYFLEYLNWAISNKEYWETKITLSSAFAGSVLLTHTSFIQSMITKTLRTV